MKNTKKIIAFLCVLAVLCAGVIISVVAASVEALYTVEQCQEKIDAVANVTTGNYDKSLALEVAYEYFKGTDPEAAEHDDLAAQLDTINTQLITAWITEVEGASGGSAKADSMALAIKQLGAHPVSDTALATRVRNAAIDTAQLLISEYEAIMDSVTSSDDKYSERMLKYRALNMLIKAAESNGALSEVAAYTGVLEDYNEIKEELNEYVLALRESIDIQIALDEFKGVVSVDEFSGKIPNFVEMGKDTVVKNQTLEKDNSFLYLISYDDPNTEPGLAGDSHMKTVLPAPGTSNYGAVYEFDLAYFDDEKIDGGLHIKGYSRNSAGGVKIYPFFFNLSGSGDIQHPLNKSTLVANPFVRGEWVHISVAVNALTYEVDLYVDYKLVASYEGDGGAAGQEISNFSNIYFGTSSSKGTIAIDNLAVYDGTAPRTASRFSGEGAKSENKLVYYAKVFSNETVSEPARVLAYEAATDIIPEFWDADGNDYVSPETSEAIKDAITKYFAFDKDAMYLTYRKNNLTEYKRLIDLVAAVERTPETLVTRKTLVSNVTAFVSSVKGEIYDDYNGYGVEPGAEPLREYRTYAAKLANFETQISNEDAIIEFSNTAIIFKGASNEAKMREYYAILKDTVRSLELSLIIEKVTETDPDTNLPVTVDRYIENTKFTGFLEAHKTYMNGEFIIDELIRKTNSKDFVGFFGQIAEYDTPAEWEENYETLNKYVVILRDLELVGKFYENYPNLDEYRAAFAVMEAEYFNPRLQDGFIDTLDGYIQSLLNTNSYVEKMGFCKVIENYIAKNEVYFDEDHVDGEGRNLGELLARFAVYAREVAVQENDYQYLLEQNTIFFINKANLLAACTTYEEKVLAYELATAYYYSMNVGSAEAQAAIAIYERIGDELEIIEACSAGLLESVARLSIAETEDEKFAALVDCCANAKYASDEIEGVAEALAEYQEAYDEYSAVVNGAREDLDCSVTVVGALRYICGVGAFMQRVINLIFS